ncbi:hypothetical protein Tco_0060353 [Tanacetum coccineum]
MAMEKDSEIIKGKKEKYKSISLKTKIESSDDETSISRSEDAEYAIVVRDFKKFIRQIGKFVRQPHEDRKSIQKLRDDKKGKSERKCFRCSDPNHFIVESLNPPQKDQKDFVGDSWSDSGDNEKEPKKEDVYLMAQDSNELGLEIEKLKLTQETLNKQNFEFTKFEKRARCVDELLSFHKSPNDRTGLGFTSAEASTSQNRKAEFVKSIVIQCTDLTDPSQKDPPASKRGPAVQTESGQNVRNFFGTEFVVVSIKPKPFMVTSKFTINNNSEGRGDSK